MAISAQHIISDVTNLATSGANPVEFRIEGNQILFWANEIRAQLIAQSLNKRDDINDIWLQTIKCLELEQVDKSECCAVTSNCYVLRSVKQLPDTIDTYKDNWIVAVTTPLGQILSKMNRFKARYAKFNKFTADTPGWYIQNSYLYIVNEELLAYVDVTGLWSDPTELENFVNCNDEACFNLDSPYPVTYNMAKTIVDIIMQTRVYPFLSVQQDVKNDGLDESLTVNKPPQLINPNKNI